MPRNQGTSRKGKPGQHERAIGLGRSLHRSSTATATSYQPPRSNGKAPGLLEDHDSNAKSNTTKSVLEMTSIDDFLWQAELANHQFQSDRGDANLVVVDETSSPYTPPSVHFHDDDDNNDERRRRKKFDFVFKELGVPRRPAWDASTTPAQLHALERASFLEWRRAIAMKEEEALRLHSTNNRNHHASMMVSVTPFEKNLEVWRQLWRVLERSACLLQLVDARNPLFYLSSDLRDYATSLGKPMMVLVNKSDYLTAQQRRVWFDYLTKQQGWSSVVFFSAYLEQQKLDTAAQQERKQQHVQLLHDKDDNVEDLVRRYGSVSEDKEVDDSDVVALEYSDSIPDQENLPAVDELTSTDIHRLEMPASSTASNQVDSSYLPPLLKREELIEAMLEFAAQHDCPPDPRYSCSKDDTESARIPFGMVGFPNVGKSSVINVLMGNSKHTHGTVKVGVAAQPGKTKHFQTLLLPKNSKVALCDCPGLVFPSFVSNTADLIAGGVYPIAQMRDPWPVVELICQRIPRNILNATYGIQLPTPSIVYPLSCFSSVASAAAVPPPTAEELLNTYCIARSMLSASSGVPDIHRASRLVIQDYATGKLLYCHEPPSLDAVTALRYHEETLQTTLQRATGAKLREKLKLQQPVDATVVASAYVPSTVPSLDVVDDDDSNDDVLLSFVDDSESANFSKKSASGSSRKKHHKQKKCKHRDVDPYGCHTSPDELLSNVAWNGVGVKAGKYSQSSGYTRPSHRGAASFDR